jgi:hypothetical protein
LMVLTYPKCVLKWPRQFLELPCLPARAKEDHKLSRWVHLCHRNYMQPSYHTAHNKIFQEWPEPSTTVWAVMRYCFPTTDHHYSINSDLLMKVPRFWQEDYSVY